MVAITKNSTGAALATTANWTPAQIPTTADDVTWLTTSIGGTCSGNFGANTLTFNGAQVAGTQTGVTHTGTLTLVGGLNFTSTNNVFWVVGGTTGSLAVGANNQTWTLHSINYASIALQSTSVNALTGTATINLVKGPGAGFASFSSISTAANFTGTFDVAADVQLVSGNSSGALPGANFILRDGAYSYGFGNSLTSHTLGGAGKSFTVLGNIVLGLSGNTFIINPNVALGSVTRTLTVRGNTTMSGTVTGTAGVTVAGASEFTQLAFDGISSGLSGPCVVSIGHFIVNASTLANRYQPTSIDVTNTTARFRYGGATSDFTFGSSLSGLGTISLSGNFAGDGMRFPAAPAAGNIATFGGKVQAQGVAASGFQNTKIRISELPQGLSFAGLALNASPIAAASITYDGAGQTKNTTVTVNSENNTSTAALTSGTYSLISSGSGPLVLSGDVQRTNTADTLSGLMSLTLGGTNTGDNKLSGVISDLDTNSATLGIRKADSGRWILSGNNTHKGLTTVVSGTLALQSNTALGSTTVGDITLTGGALRLEGENRSIVKSGRTLTFGGGTLEVAADSGDASLACGPVTITGNNGVVNVESGSSLSLNNTGLITGSLGLIKNGVGSFSLPTSANTFTGDFNINDGDVSIGSIANSGSGASWGAGTSPVKIPKNLKINGTGGTTNRPVMFVGSTPSIESAGAGTVTFSATSQGGGNRTITLKGDNTGNNTFSGPLKESGLYQSMPLNVARSRHASIGLQNGKVLVLGGNNISSSFNSCELYDPATESWTITGAMNSARFNCDDNALLLNNGKVLVVAGSTSSAASSVISVTSPSYNCELFNPSTNSWSAAASTAIARTYVNTTLLNDGRVLMTGGFGSINNILNTCQIYTPDSGAGTWTTNTPSFTTARYLHTTTLLSNGNVLLVGGWNGSASLNVFQVFDPSGNSGVGSWNTSSTFSAQTRYGHIAVPIFNKTKVLIAGGAVNSNTTGNTYSTCLIYDVAGGWTSAAPMNVARYRPTYQVLSDGRVFVAGGSGNDGQSINTAEIYDPIADTWTLLPDALASIASWPGSSTLSLANDDRVLISGGYNSNSTVTNICNTYNPSQTLALTKSGTGKWILGGGTLSYSGTTALEAGTLDLGGTSRVLSGGITMSGGTLQNGSATLESDVTVTGGVGSITAQLAGTSALSMTGGTVTLTQADSNAYTGGTVIGAGAILNAITSVDPGAVPGGKVLGEGNVTVSGTLKTGSSSTQRGQLKYGGTLTFNGGSKIYLGGA